MTPQKDQKPRIAMYWCASCGGCEESILDLAEELLWLKERGRNCLLAHCHGHQI